MISGELALGTALISAAMIAIEAAFARADGMLTVQQMRKSFPQYAFGLPFQWHFGVWGDALLLTPLMAWIVATVSSQWSFGEITIATVAGTIAGSLFHWIYLQYPLPDSLAWKGGITRAGWVHFAYTGLSLAVFGLLFFATEARPAGLALVSVLLLAVHVTVAGKLFLGLANRYVLHFDWCPMQHKEPGQWAVQLAAYAALAGLAMWVWSA